MSHKFTDADLEAYLDEALDPGAAAEVEQALRDDSELLRRLSFINGRRNAGIHTLGEIWRRNQIGVPSSDDMGRFMLGVLPQENSEYIKFRIETLKCRYTIAMLRDLQTQSSNVESPKTDGRRKKYFDSSAGLLRRKKD